jgi:hypothetical protein
LSERLQERLEAVGADVAAVGDGGVAGEEGGGFDD